MAQAIVYTEFGGPEVLHLVDIPDPVVGAGEVLVRIEAAGVNPIDTKLRSGARASSPITAPRHVGFDGAGVIDMVGVDVAALSVGDRVAIRNTLGTYATDLAVSAADVVVLPDSVTTAEGASIGIPAGTAYQSLKSLAVTAGDTLLVHAGSGAVGQSAIQFAVQWGATVIASASAARHGRMRELGAIPVEYGPGLVERVRAVAPNGVAVALDCAGTDEALASSLDLVADRNRIATIVRGADAAGLGIRAFSGGSPVPLTEQEEAWRAEALSQTVDLLAQGKFSFEFGDEFPLAEAAIAHQEVQLQATGGKLILRP